MIIRDMRLYDFFTLGELDTYGQATMPAPDAEPEGQIKMAVNISSQSVQDNINYESCNYVGLTHDADVSDKYIIQYGDERLKVLYINDKGRLKQVFMVKL